MKSIIIAGLCGVVSICIAENVGIKAVVERMKNMKRIERPVAQIMQDGVILSVYADERVETNAVRLVRMSESTKAKVSELESDKETLAAAKKLVTQVKSRHGKDVEGLSDAEVVASSQEVFNTTGKDTATGTAVGLLLAAAAAAISKGKKPKEDKKENGKDK